MIKAVFYSAFKIKKPRPKRTGLTIINLRTGIQDPASTILLRSSLSPSASLSLLLQY